jgi:hypothetical protein
MLDWGRSLIVLVVETHLDPLVAVWAAEERMLQLEWGQLFVVVRDNVLQPPQAQEEGTYWFPVSPVLGQLGVLVGHSLFLL